MESHPVPIVRYEDMESRLRTGDIILFRGVSRRSRMIEMATESAFSHVGMVVRSNDAASPLLWHTDPRAVTKDVADGGTHRGAQLNDLGSALARMTSPEYGDTPYVRQLQAERTPEMDVAVQHAIALANDVAFPSLARIVKDWLLGHLRIATTERYMECAELVAFTYQQMGLMSREPPPNAYLPNNFSDRMKLPLLNGATLGTQVGIQWTGAVERPTAPA